MIGIKNMKMPRDCYGCNFFDIDSRFGETEYYCLAADKEIEDYVDENYRADICPLVEVEQEKEFHWYEASDTYMPICNSYYFTKKAFVNNEKIIHSSQSCFFSQDTIRKGYKLFAHFINGQVVEVHNGMGTAAGKEVRPEHNLERMLLAGSFGELS